MYKDTHKPRLPAMRLLAYTCAERRAEDQCQRGAQQFQQGELRAMILPGRQVTYSQICSQFRAPIEYTED